MENVLDRIVSYIPHHYDLSTVSRDWYQSLDINNKMIMEDLARKYPQSVSLLDLARNIVFNGDTISLNQLLNISNPRIAGLPWGRLIGISGNTSTYIMIHGRFPSIRNIVREKELELYDIDYILPSEDIDKLDKGLSARMYIMGLMQSENVGGLRQILSIIGKDRFKSLMTPRVVSTISEHVPLHVVSWLKKMDLISSILIGKPDPFLHSAYISEKRYREGTMEERRIILINSIDSRYPIIYQGRISKDNIIPIFSHMDHTVSGGIYEYLDSIGIHSEWLAYYFKPFVDYPRPIDLPSSFWKKLLASAIAYKNEWLIKRIVKKHKSEITEEMEEKMLSLAPTNQIRELIEKELY